MVVGEVASQRLPEMVLAQNDDVIEALPTGRTDEALDIGILPRGLVRDQDLLNPHVSNSLAEPYPVDRVTVSQQVGGRVVPRECLHHLLGCPLGTWMFRHIELDDPTAIGGEHKEDEEQPELDGGYDEEVDGDEVVAVIKQECLPSR